MKDKIAYCGLDCEKCDAYLATVNHDEALREKTAKLWSEWNQTVILPEQIYCEGCRADGLKSVYCESLCGIRQCALKKGVETCGDCPEMETCQIVGAILSTNPEARQNLNSMCKTDVITGKTAKGIIIQKAEKPDLPEILKLQYLAYQSEAALFGSKDISPLKQTLDEVIEEFDAGIFLKVQDGEAIIASVRAKMKDETVYVGKLMVHPEYQHQGIGSKLLSEIEKYFPNRRYELFTSTRSVNNIRLYQSLGYSECGRKKVDNDLVFIHLEKIRS